MSVCLVVNGSSRPRRGIWAAQTAMLQIARDYASLPDVRELKLHEIMFYYDGIRSELESRTAS